jgi:diacylglycerol kinase family enzyme
MTIQDAALAPRAGRVMTPAPPLRRIVVVANEHSGSVGPGAAAQARAIAEALGFEVKADAVAPHELRAQLSAAIATRPDLLVVIAGDGTANMAATLCGPDGPLLATLPGGTMNMLPRALYGARDWKTALTAILKDGAVMPVAGGEIEGHAFHVAAILGNPALWARSREAMRDGRLREALERAIYAWRRAFRSKLHFTIVDGMHGRAEGLGLLCPIMSKVITDDAPALEAAAADPPGMLSVLTLGIQAFVLPFVGQAKSGSDWRRNPHVRTGPCLEGHASGRRRLHAILDGEPMKLPKYVRIKFKPVAFRALVVASDGGHPAGGATI